MRLGGLDEVPFVLGEGGERLVLVEGVEREVVVATARDLVESGFGSSVSEGVFLLGTGSNGVCESMLATGGLVFALMQTAFWGYRLPATRVYQPQPPPPGSACQHPRSSASTPPPAPPTSPSSRPPGDNFVNLLWGNYLIGVF